MSTDYIYDDSGPETGLPSNVRPFVRPARPVARSAAPSCPYCGRHDTTSRVGHECGEFYCSCGSLFTGSDDEWRRLADHRRMAAERRSRDSQEAG